MTPKTFKAKITHEGQEIEVEVPIPEGMVFMPQATFDAELTRRATSLSASAVATALEGVLEDKDHLTAAVAKAKEAGLLKDPEPGEDIEARIATERTRWDKDVLAPVQTDLDTSRTKNTGLLSSRLAADLLVAAGGRVKAAFLKPPMPGKPAPIVTMVRDLFKYNEEHDEHFVDDGKEGFVFSATPQEGLPYMNPAEFMQGWLDDEAQKDLLDERKQKGPNLGETNLKQDGNVVIISREDAADHRLYRAAQDQADKDGKELQIEPES